MILGKTNPLQLAKAIGHADQRLPGTIWMPELELQYLLLCAKRAVCDDNKSVRIRRHLRIVGPKSTGKTTQTCKFVRDLTGAVRYGDAEAGTKSPTYLEIGGGTTWEPIRGGVYDGNLIMPMLHEVDYLLCGELTAFIDSSEDGKRKISVINEALEEGIVTLTQMGIRGVKASKKEAFAEECAQDGRIHFNPDKGIIRYPVRAFFTCASWPLAAFDRKLASICNVTGFDSRMHHSIYDPSEEQDKIHKKDPHGDANKGAEAALLDFNRYAWRCRFKTLDAPPVPLIQKVIAYYYEEYARINQLTDVPISQFAGDRDYVDAAQLLIAFAMMRRIVEAYDSGIDPPVFEALDYTPEDIRAVCGFRCEHLMNAEKMAAAESKEDALRDTVFRELVAFAKTKLRPKGDYPSDVDWGRQDAPLIDTVELNHFIAQGIATGKPCSRQTAHNHIGKMRRCGFLSLMENKKNCIADNVASAIGLILEQERDPDEDMFHDMAPEDFQTEPSPPIATLWGDAPW